MTRRQFTYETQQFTRVQYLRDILSRLEDEVGTIFDAIKQHNAQSQRKVGFWAGTRLLMPVVETVAKTVEKNPWELLEQDLNVPTGSLVWQMFRHSLTHGDLLSHVRYQSQDVGWGGLLMGQGHIIQQNHIALDPYSLYDNLVNFLNSEIQKDDQTLIDINVGINYTNPEQYIIDDFEKLK